MFKPLHDLKGCSIRATDGDVGHVADFYFDDESWAIRYLIVDTSGWLSGDKVLISPMSVGRPDWSQGSISVSITKEQVKNSPDIDTDKPVSRQTEQIFLDYYGYPYYWGGAGLWGMNTYPYQVMSGACFGGLDHEFLSLKEQRDRSVMASREGDHYDMHLRSCNEVIGYHIEASDGNIGHVKGFLVDDETWAISQIIVETSNWWLGHETLIDPKSIREVRWAEHVVIVKLTRQAVRDAPVFDPTIKQVRANEAGLYRH